MACLPGLPVFIIKILFDWVIEACDTMPDLQFKIEIKKVVIFMLPEKKGVASNHNMLYYHVVIECIRLEKVCYIWSITNIQRLS